MATQTNLIPGSGYGSPYVDSLVWGCAWVGGPVTYYFGFGAVAEGDSAIGAFTGANWSASQVAAFETALAQYSAVCNLTFEQTGSPGEADIVWWLAPNAALGTGVLGMHEVPDGTWSQTYGYFNYQHSTWANLTPGSYGYITVIHELGHGMGLAHPHDGGDHDDATVFPGVRSSSSPGTFGLNQGIWTTMSYNDGWSSARTPSTNYGYQAGLMALDIAALQAVYGANMATRTGDDTYQLPTLNGAGTGWSCLWDAGGVDTISNAGSLLGCTINLNAASLSGSTAGGIVSRVNGILGGYTIANGAVFENAIGGAGKDTLIGNAAANMLDGGAGADRMNGGAGDDIYRVDNGADNVVELANQGLDTVYASVTHTLKGNVETLVLTGSANINGTGNALANLLQGNGGRNTLNGGGGADVLVGGGGGDRLTGGLGGDTFRFADGDAGTGSLLRDLVTDFKVAQGDLIDLSAIDADQLMEGDQAFAYIGGAAFSGSAGELRFAANLLAGDLDGDGLADFEIQLNGVASLGAASLLA